MIDENSASSGRSGARLTEIPAEPVTGPSAWRSADFTGEDD
ncbi:hypothetical protein ACH427_26275 [Streptomyces sp. NPDC020379]